MNSISFIILNTFKFEAVNSSTYLDAELNNKNNLFATFFFSTQGLIRLGPTLKFDSQQLQTSMPNVGCESEPKDSTLSFGHCPAPNNLDI